VLPDPLVEHGPPRDEAEAEAGVDHGEPATGELGGADKSAGDAGPAQSLQPADVGANEGLWIAADTIDGGSRPLQMQRWTIDAALTCDIQDVAVRGLRPAEAGKPLYLAILNGAR
jgi:hypothetical protein